MRKKGFTLVELLAVIVILAIIALIATPMIMGVIDKAKKGAAESSAYGYIEAVDNYRVMALLDGKESLGNAVYTVSELSNYGVTVKGELPKDGWVEIQDGKVIDYQLQVGGYSVKYDSATKKAVASKTEATYLAYTVGDVVTLADGSNWYVIEDKGSTSSAVTLLSKYLVNITTNKQDEALTGMGSGGVYFDDGSRYNENNTYCLVNLTPGDYYGTDRYACNAYAAVEGIFDNYGGTYGELCDYDKETKTYSNCREAKGTVTEDSLIKKYVDSYVSTLNLGNNLVSSGLLTRNQLKNIGCDDSTSTCPEEYSWLSSYSYWLQDPNSDSIRFVKYFSSEDKTYSYGADATGYRGLRPVITIHKDAITA